MACIRPFAAWRPNPNLASRICELPYDVVSTSEARLVAAGNPLSFFHISRPEIDLPEDVNPYSANVYAQGRQNFAELIKSGSLRRDPTPCYYLYRQVMGDHSQTGLVAAASCEEYGRNLIKKHELTRPDKEEDRLRHIDALNAQTGPAFLTYRATPSLNGLLSILANQAPDIDFVAKDGVRHTSWVINSPENIRRIDSEFAAIPCLYIADGHHRSAAAYRIFQSRKGSGNSAFFLTVIFPHDQLQILPYNRVLRDLNGLSAVQLREKLAAVCELNEGASASPARPHELSLYLEQKWLGLQFRPEILSQASSDPAEKLDVSLLQRLVLGPVFGIHDPRTSNRIGFIGGIRGIKELEKTVESGEYACAFSLYPTTIDDLMTIADAGQIMPPKSTWFEPKLRDGMFCYEL
jgi:uncharacterized protein (DUF1015 family)